MSVVFVDLGVRLRGDCALLERGSFELPSAIHHPHGNRRV